MKQSLKSLFNQIHNATQMHPTHTKAIVKATPILWSLMLAAFLSSCDNSTPELQGADLNVVTKMQTPINSEESVELPAPNIERASANRVTQPAPIIALMKSYYLQRGDSWYSLDTEAGNSLREFRGVEFTFEEKTNEADRLNGVEWRGDGLVTARAYRLYLDRGVTPWLPKVPTQYITASFKNGKWEDISGSLTFLKKPDISQIPKE